MSFNSPSDELQELIRSASSGSDAAFAKLLERYAPLITSEVAGFKNCGFDEDDVRQEAYIAFYQAVKRYSEDEAVSFGLYAKICIKNRLISAVRKFSKFANELPDDLSTPVVDSEGLDPYELLVGKENAELLRDTINRLLSVYEKTVLHYYIAGFSPSEIALLLRKDERSVSNALFRIRGKLKCLLNDK